MKTSLIRIISVCTINFLLNYLLLFPLGLFKYITTPDLKMFAIVGIVVSGIPALATMLFYRIIDKKPLTSLGIGFKRKDFLFSILSMAVTVMVYFTFIVFLSNFGVVQAKWNSQALSQGSFYLSFVMVFLAWFVAAFYEELLFRGYFVANLSFLSVKKLYIFTSIIFMAFHIFKGLDPVSIIILMSMSCVFLYVYLKSNSLLPGTFAHLIFNFSTSHLAGGSDIAVVKYDGDVGIYNLLFIFIFMVITILLTKVFYRNENGNRPSSLSSPKLYS